MWTSQPVKTLLVYIVGQQDIKKSTGFQACGQITTEEGHEREMRKERSKYHLQLQLAANMRIRCASIFWIVKVKTVVKRS